MMEDIYRQLLARNALETKPFLSVHAANATLQNQVDALELKCEALERECSSQHQQLHDSTTTPSGKGASAALKSEARLRDKMEKLQEELNETLRVHVEDAANALKTAKSLSDMKDLNTAQEATISNLKDENDRAEKTIAHLTNELQDSKSRTKLAEQQYSGLKETIRTLQEENDTLKEENRNLVNRLVTDKEKTSDEVNILNEMVDKLRKEVSMLRSLKIQEDKRRSWFGKSAVSDGVEAEVDERKKSIEVSSRRFGTMGVIIPSEPKHILQAHTAESTCVRYDNSGTDLLATSSSDNTVKVWDTNNGQCRATLRGGSGHAMTCCDIGDGLAVGGSSDKTCRVWNLRTERMIHQLVGHSNKITCVRLLGSVKAVLTGSSDRSMKLWDISRNTYRQTTTLRHSSTTCSVDVGSDSFTVVSGHMDGGLRFWDARTGERTADISNLHEGGITSVQLHPTIGTQVLTNGKDSCLKIVDIRTCAALFTLKHDGFRTSFSWSSSAFSPDGAYAASGSSTNGDIFIWRVLDGEFQKKLNGHKSGVGGFAWGRGGSNGQQVASVDRSGNLILWA